MSAIFRCFVTAVLAVWSYGLAANEMPRFDGVYVELRSGDFIRLDPVQPSDSLHRVGVYLRPYLKQLQPVTDTRREFVIPPIPSYRQVLPRNINSTTTIVEPGHWERIPSINPVDIESIFIRSRSSRLQFVSGLVASSEFLLPLLPEGEVHLLPGSSFFGIDEIDSGVVDECVEWYPEWHPQAGSCRVVIDRRGRMLATKSSRLYSLIDPGCGFSADTDMNILSLDESSFQYFPRDMDHLFMPSVSLGCWDWTSPSTGRFGTILQTSDGQNIQHFMFLHHQPADLELMIRPLVAQYFFEATTRLIYRIEAQ